MGASATSRKPHDSTSPKRARGAGASVPAEPEPHTASFTRLLTLCRHYLLESDLHLIESAYDTAARAHAGVKRRSGEPYIEHPIAVAAILAGLAVDAEGIAAALLHDTVEDTPVTQELLVERFGHAIAEIVDGVTKFSAVEAPPIDDDDEFATPSINRKDHANAETLRKLFVVMLHDPRVVLIKLADRLHNMRTMGHMPPAKQMIKSREVLDVYAPLAGRIGLYAMRGELEDLAFLYLRPDELSRVRALLEDERTRRKKWAQQMCDHMRHELDAVGIPACVNWRVKRPYRAWAEANAAGTDIAQLNDLLAFYVLVFTKEECYSSLGHIHQLWLPFGRTSDYIGAPKADGYRSLHTAVFALDGRPAQIRIRTHEMHRAAHHGVAATWMEAAARGERVAGTLAQAAQLPDWVAQVRSWEEDLGLSAMEFVHVVRDEMLREQVFVSTPKGDVVELPAGSTVLDFAYRIHTRVGDKTTGALVHTASPDGVTVARYAPLDYVVRTGDVVQALTDPDAHPHPEWLSIAQTVYAREKIGRALRLQGRVGEPQATTPATLLPLTHPDGVPAIPRLAPCCAPVPGDEIVGLPSARSSGVTIHRPCCRTLRAALARRPNAATIPVDWEQLPPMSYLLNLEIYGQDHPGVVHEVSAALAELGLNITQINANANSARNKADITLTVVMPPDMRREALYRRLFSVPGVTEVARDLRKGCDS